MDQHLLLTRVFPPVVSLNLFVLVGWITTGVAVYALARRLGLGQPSSLVAALAVEMLPSMPTMAANYTSYVFIGIPVYVVCRAIDAATAPSRRNLLWLVGSLGVTAAFDAYWFYFSVGSTAVVLLVNGRTLLVWLRDGPRWGRLLAVLVGMVLVVLPLALLAMLGFASGSSSFPSTLGRGRTLRGCRNSDHPCTGSARPSKAWASRSESVVWPHSCGCCGHGGTPRPHRLLQSSC